MTIRYEANQAILAGTCGAEEAEDFLAFLRAHADATLLFEPDAHVHTAVAQVMLVLRPRVAGPLPAGPLAALLADLAAPPAQPKPRRRPRAAAQKDKTP